LINTGRTYTGMMINSFFLRSTDLVGTIINNVQIKKSRKGEAYWT